MLLAGVRNGAEPAIIIVNPQPWTLNQDHMSAEDLATLLDDGSDEDSREKQVREMSNLHAEGGVGCRLWVCRTGVPPL